MAPMSIIVTVLAIRPCTRRPPTAVSKSFACFSTPAPILRRAPTTERRRSRSRKNTAMRKSPPSSAKNSSDSLKAPLRWSIRAGRFTPCLRLPPGLACRTGEMFPVRQFCEFTVLAALILSAVFAPSGAGQPKGGSAVAMKLSSSAFEPGASIPKKFTCDGADVSPALAWSDAPAGTQSFALIADDPDAPVGTWVHWVLYDLPGAARDLPEGVAKQEQQLANGARQGRNDFGKIGYGGPCPPRGSAHRYFFK